MKRLALILLALLLLAGCAQKYECADYTALGKSAHAMEDLFPEYKAQLRQCAVDNLAWGILCGQGYKPDEGTYEKCRELALLLVQKPAEAPATPTPALAKTTPPAASQAFTDDINPATITFVQGPDIGRWPVTHDLTASLSGNNVLLKQSATSAWPTKPYQDKPLVGNSWVVANIGGKWYGASFEWLGKGTQSRGKYTVAGDHIKYPKVFPADWRPAPGETIYVCVASLSRGGMRSVDERTPLKKIVWE